MAEEKVKIINIEIPEEILTLTEILCSVCGFFNQAYYDIKECPVCSTMKDMGFYLMNNDSQNKPELRKITTEGSVEWLRKVAINFNREAIECLISKLFKREIIEERLILDLHENLLYLYVFEDELINCLNLNLTNHWIQANCHKITVEPFQNHIHLDSLRTIKVLKRIQKNERYVMKMD